MKYLLFLLSLCIISGCSSAPQPMKFSYIPFTNEVYKSTLAKNILVAKSRFELKSKFVEIGIFKVTGKIDTTKLKEEASIYGADALIIEDENVTLILIPNKKIYKDEKLI